MWKAKCLLCCVPFTVLTLILKARDLAFCRKKRIIIKHADNTIRMFLPMMPTHKCVLDGTGLGLGITGRSTVLEGTTTI